MAQTKELVAKIIFAIAAAISVAAVVVICVFIFGNGIPAIAEIGFLIFSLEPPGAPQMMCTASG